MRFLEGADLIIHDAQYTLDDFPAKAGWGHAPVERVVDYAMLAQAKQLALFHHDPARHDAAVDRLCELARARVAAGASALQVFAAAEGQSVELTPGPTSPHPAIAPAASALRSLSPREGSTVLVVDDEPDMVFLLETALRAEGIRVLTATSGEAALVQARQECPHLILLDMHLPGLDGLAVCQALRAEADPRLGNIPIVMLTGVRLHEADLVEAFAAGATDYLTKPVKPTLVRSRVRAWLQRTAMASS